MKYTYCEKIIWFAMHKTILDFPLPYKEISIKFVLTSKVKNNKILLVLFERVF